MSHRRGSRSFRWLAILPLGFAMGFDVHNRTLGIIQSVMCAVLFVLMTYTLIATRKNQ